TRRLAMSSVVVRLVPVLSKIRMMGPVSPFMGAPPLQLPGVLQRALPPLPVQVCEAGASRSSSFSSNGWRSSLGQTRQRPPCFEGLEFRCTYRRHQVRSMLQLLNDASTRSEHHSPEGSPTLGRARSPSDDRHRSWWGSYPSSPRPPTTPVLSSFATWGKEINRTASAGAG